MTDQSNLCVLQLLRTLERSLQEKLSCQKPASLRGPRHAARGECMPFSFVVFVNTFNSCMIVHIHNATVLLHEYKMPRFFTEH
jgi:hypothetical protein